MINEKRYRVYVCCNIHCHAHGAAALVQLLDHALRAHNLQDDVDVRVSSCQNRCDFGPNITVWPGPVRYAQLAPDAIERIVAEHLRGGEPVRELLYQADFR